MLPGVDSVSSWNLNMQQLLQNWKVIQFWQPLTSTDRRMPSLDSSTTLQDFPQCCTLSKFHTHELHILELFFISKSLLSSALKLETAGSSEIFLLNSWTAWHYIAEGIHCHLNARSHLCDMSYSDTTIGNRAQNLKIFMVTWIMCI